MGTLSQVNADLTTLTDNDSTPGPDIITVTATDSSGHSATPQTIAVTVAHVAPTIAASGSPTFSGGGSAVTLLSAVPTLTDVDSGGNLAGATVSISTGFLSGDTLNFTNQNGITGSYDTTHGVLTLTGTASIANYQAALDPSPTASARRTAIRPLAALTLSRTHQLDGERRQRQQWHQQYRDHHADGCAYGADHRGERQPRPSPAAARR